MNHVAVVTSYSFDPDVEVILFPTREKACGYIREKFAESIEEEKNNDPDSTGFSEEDSWITEESDYASIIWHSDYEDSSDRMTWTVAEAKECE